MTSLDASADTTLLVLFTLVALWLLAHFLHGVWTHWRWKRAHRERERRFRREVQCRIAEELRRRAESHQ